jgi:hypothetical protein
MESIPNHRPHYWNRFRVFRSASESMIESVQISGIDSTGGTKVFARRRLSDVASDGLQRSFFPRYTRVRVRASWGTKLEATIRRLHNQENRHPARQSKATGVFTETSRYQLANGVEGLVRLRQEKRSKCGAVTRKGTPCQRTGLGRGGKCPNHGGMSTGPRTPAGKARALKAMQEGLARWRATRVRANAKEAHQTQDTRSKDEDAILVEGNASATEGVAGAFSVRRRCFIVA